MHWLRVLLPEHFTAPGSTNNSGQGANFVRINGTTGIGTKVGRFGAGLTWCGNVTLRILMDYYMPRSTNRAL